MPNRLQNVGGVLGRWREPAADADDRRRGAAAVRTVAHVSCYLWWRQPLLALNRFPADPGVRPDCIQTDRVRRAVAGIIHWRRA